MELASGYSDAGINAFNANQNMLGTNLMNSISAQQAQQQQQMAMWNAQAAAMTRPTPPGYGQVHLPYLSGSFGSPAAAGTYSPGSGRSSFSGTSLGGGSNVWNTGAAPFNSYGLPGGGGAGSFSPSSNYPGGMALDNDGQWRPSGGIGSDAARAPDQPAITPFQSYVGGYNPFASQSFNPAAQRNTGAGYGGGAAAAPMSSWHSPTTASPWEGAGFDAVKYLNAPGNEDLKAAGVNPWQHAQQHGFAENRQGLGWNPETYLKQNQDVRDAGVDPWKHAQEFGFKEGRTGLEGLTQAPSGGGIGSDAAAAPGAAVTRNPRVQLPQNWQATFNNMVHGSGGNPYALGGATWQPSSRDNIAASMAAAQDRMRAGQGWTIAQQPPAASQGTLTSRINQGIYDIGNAGDAYGRSIGGGYGMGLPNQGQGTLTPQDLAIPHAYPPEVRWGFGGSAETGGGGA